MASTAHTPSEPPPSPTSSIASAAGLDRSGYMGRTSLICSALMSATAASGSATRGSRSLHRCSRSGRPFALCRSPPDEIREHVVEARPEPLDRVARSRKHSAVSGEACLEDVADDVERRAVRTRDDELREPGGRELVEGDLGLPG